MPFLYVVFSQIMELAVAEHFLAPVDATKYPAYYVIVEYPMDLNTIKSRVENHYYRWVARDGNLIAISLNTCILMVTNQNRRCAC